jgi:hypothetical protein
MNGNRGDAAYVNLLNFCLRIKLLDNEGCELVFSTAITNKKFNGEKMKTIVTVLLLLVVSIASNAQTLDGSWQGKFSGPNGDMDLVFTFKVNADTLNGDATSEMGSLPIENGKINGNEKGIYDNLIKDLSLNPDSVPLLAGELVNADEMELVHL